MHKQAVAVSRFNMLVNITELQATCRSDFSTVTVLYCYIIWFAVLDMKHVQGWQFIAA